MNHLVLELLPYARMSMSETFYKTPTYFNYDEVLVFDIHSCRALIREKVVDTLTLVGKYPHVNPKMLLLNIISILNHEVTIGGIIRLYDNNHTEEIHVNVLSDNKQYLIRYSKSTKKFNLFDFKNKRKMT